MITKTISVADDFSKYPAGRSYNDDFWNCAEHFLNMHLSDALVFYDRVVIDLDGTMGYSSSWLHEVFANLHPGLKRKIKIKVSNESILHEVAEYLAVSVKTIRANR